MSAISVRVRVRPDGTLQLRSAKLGPHPYCSCRPDPDGQLWFSWRPGTNAVTVPAAT